MNPKRALNFDLDGWAWPAGTAFRTAVPWWFADTEEVTGSNPVAPTNTVLTSGNAGQLAVRDRHLDGAAHPQRPQPLPHGQGRTAPWRQFRVRGSTRRPPRRPYRGWHRSHSAVGALSGFEVGSGTVVGAKGSIPACGPPSSRQLPGATGPPGWERPSADKPDRTEPRRTRGIVHQAHQRLRAQPQGPAADRPGQGAGQQAREPPQARGAAPALCQALTTLRSAARRSGGGAGRGRARLRPGGRWPSAGPSPDH